MTKVELDPALRAALGGGPERHHAKTAEQGKLPVRDRVGLLLDEGSFVEDALLANASARPGTPLGEPGVRQLPRQTHERILATVSRGTLTVTENGQSALSAAEDQAPTTK